MGEKSPPWLKQQPPFAALGRDRSHQASGDSPWHPLGLCLFHARGNVFLYKLLRDVEKTTHVTAGSLCQAQVYSWTRGSRVFPSSVHSAPGAVEGLKALWGQEPAQVSLPGSGEDVGCIHRHSSLNLGLQGSLEEPRPDVRFQGHSHYKPHTEGSEGTAHPAPTLWDSCCFGRTCSIPLIYSTSLALTAAEHNPPPFPLSFHQREEGSF